MNEPSITLEVARYSPEEDDEPALQRYEIPYREDWVVLDALNHIKDYVDESLTYRWSCRMGVCGSCGTMVNGEPKLTCSTFLRDYYPGVVTIEPMANFPVARDLVIEIDAFMEKLQAVKPWIIRDEDDEKPVSEGEHRQSPAELAEFKQFTMCINCMLCYSACPVYGLEESFVGPAALALAHRYNLDSRDKGRAAREEAVAANKGIWACSFVGACSEVCPHAVDPAAAIQQIKIASTLDYFLGLLPGKGK
ncbi:MAG: succinate dehydrogenase/fumarate reductase iron-sulfur subunit [Rhodospirillales bacterium]|nr:succinate dehydrogenase/fumarate reductase iron-sulfur subunit [Rhodospirillales bacterium]